LISIHPIHRRLAEITLKAKSAGGYHSLSQQEKLELDHCLAINLHLIRKLDSLRSLAFLAFSCGDLLWHHDICAQIEVLETIEKKLLL
jgi:hypothetical protein